MSVMASRELSPTSKLVFAALVMCSFRDGYLVAMSHAAIGEVTSLSRPTALAALKQLEENGLIKRQGVGKNGVQVYQLAHRRLPQGKKRQAEPGAAKRAPLACTKCRRESGWLSKEAYCRRCIRDGEIRRIVREEVANIA